MSFLKKFIKQFTLTAQPTIIAPPTTATLSGYNQFTYANPPPNIYLGPILYQQLPQPQQSPQQLPQQYQPLQQQQYQQPQQQQQYQQPLQQSEERKSLNCLEEHKDKKVAILQTMLINEDLLERLKKTQQVSTQIFGRDIGIKEIIELLVENTNNLRLLFQLKDLNIDNADGNLLLNSSLHLCKTITSFIENVEKDIEAEKKKKNIILINLDGEEITEELFMRYFDYLEKSSLSDDEKKLYERKITPIENFLIEKELEEEDKIPEFIFPESEKYVDKKYIKKQDRYEYCVYCMENFTKGQDICRTVCKHIIHKDCFTEWISLNKKCFFCNNSF